MRNKIRAQSSSGKKTARVNIKFDHGCASFDFELQYQGSLCQAAFCPAFKKKTVENGRRWLKFPLAQIPPNQAIALQVKATYTLNGNTLIEY